MAGSSARRSRVARAALAAAAVLALAACSQAPALRTPEIPVPPAYREAGQWVVARPADDLPRDAWWTLYGDAELDALERRLVENSPDLAAAFARWTQARSTADQARASKYPAVTSTANTLTLRQSDLRPLRVPGPGSPDDYRSSTLEVDVSYEVDLWGRVANLVASGDALEKAARADLESARLSLQAQLADAWVTLRGLDREAALLAQTEAAYARTLELIRGRFDAGISSALDVARAETQLASVRSQLQQSSAQRAVLEHAIAALVGAPASGFAIAAREVDVALPNIPVGVPSTLLQRRPDVAAAQRRMESANASVGVARSAFFPTFTLAGAVGYQSSDIRNWLQAPNVFWAVGPALFLTLFDGGRRDAEVARTQAVLDEAAAKYRGVAVAAFQQVEDSLALLDRYGAAAQREREAVAASQRSLELAANRYREGAASYLEVVASQASLLQARRSALDLETRQRRASVQLVRALGGGWTPPAD